MKAFDKENSENILERGGPFKTNLETDWMDLMSFKVDQLYFLLPVKPGSNSLKL